MIAYEQIREANASLRGEVYRLVKEHHAKTGLVVETIRIEQHGMADMETSMMIIGRITIEVRVPG